MQTLLKRPFLCCQTDQQISTDINLQTTNLDDSTEPLIVQAKLTNNQPLTTVHSHWLSKQNQNFKKTKVSIVLSVIVLKPVKALAMKGTEQQHFFLLYKIWCSISLWTRHHNSVMDKSTEAGQCAEKVVTLTLGNHKGYNPWDHAFLARSPINVTRQEINQSIKINQENPHHQLDEPVT